MSNKEVLQAQNERLGNNNLDLSSILETINNLPTVEPTTPPVELNYITDGLISWWEGMDGFDENGNWNSRVGDDYISVSYTDSSITTEAIPTVTNNGAVLNDGGHALVTQQDYCKQNYTIQAVGYFDNGTNSTNSSMNMLVAMNMGASPMIGMFGSSETDNRKLKSMMANGSNITQGTMYDIYRKIFSGSICLTNAPIRNQASALNHVASVNGSNWFSATAANVTHTSKGNNMTVLCYYEQSYRSTGAALYSLRVYNRQLTQEELQHNYAIDNARFHMSDWWN